MCAAQSITSPLRTGRRASRSSANGSEAGHACGCACVSLGGGSGGGGGGSMAAAFRKKPTEPKPCESERSSGLASCGSYSTLPTNSRTRIWCSWRSDETNESRDTCSRFECGAHVLLGQLMISSVDVGTIKQFAHFGGGGGGLYPSVQWGSGKFGLRACSHVQTHPVERASCLGVLQRHYDSNSAGARLDIQAGSSEHVGKCIGNYKSSVQYRYRVRAHLIREIEYLGGRAPVMHALPNQQRGARVAQCVREAVEREMEPVQGGASQRPLSVFSHWCMEIERDNRRASRGSGVQGRVVGHA
eukprot:4617072-Pleurochrysis_carterae.AAC.6